MAAEWDRTERRGLYIGSHVAANKTESNTELIFETRRIMEIEAIPACLFLCSIDSMVCRRTEEIICALRSLKKTHQLQCCARRAAIDYPFYLCDNVR